MKELTAVLVSSKQIESGQTEQDHDLLALHLVGAGFSSSLEPDHVLQTVTEQMVNFLAIESCAIFEWDRSADIIYPLTNHQINNGRTREALPGPLALDDYPIFRWVLLEQQSWQLTIDQPNLTLTELTYLRQTGADRVLLLPMIHHNRSIGLVTMISRATVPFAPEQIALAELLTSQAAGAIENSRLYDEVHQRIDELTVLTTISQIITSTLDLREMLTIVTDLTTPLLDVVATSVVLFNDTREHLWYGAASGVGADFVWKKRLAPGQGIMGWVVQQGEPALVPNVSQDSRFSNEFDQKSGFNTRSILCVPLQVKGQTIGAIAAMNKKNCPFDQDDLRILSSLAGPAAIAIENARLYEQAQREIEERKRTEKELQLNQKFSQIYARHVEALEILHDVGLRLMNHLDTDSVLALISQAVLDLIPEAAGCVLHLVSAEGQQLLPVVFFAGGNGKMVYSSLGIEEIALEVMAARDTINIPNVAASPCQPDLPGICSLLMTPLVDNHDRPPLGTLMVYSDEPDLFGQEHQHILSILAGQAAVAITKARFFEQRELVQTQEKQTIRNLFQRYVSPAVVERLVEGHENLALGGKRQEISVLFADIRGFTNFSENLAPEALVEVLNQYLALAVDSVLAHEGTLDKFMGDAVMAFFNAPLPQADHQLRAVKAALMMQRTIANHNAAVMHHGPLSFGIGIHVGPAVAGNIGTAQQMNYTAIGDTVNLAKRLQENAQGGQIILSQSAYELVKDAVIVKELGPLAVKGRTKPVLTYRLIDLF